MATLNSAPGSPQDPLTNQRRRKPRQPTGAEPHPCPVPLTSVPAGDTLSQTASNPPKHENKPDRAGSSQRSGGRQSEIASRVTVLGA
jgi:hypothetical protein